MDPADGSTEALLDSTSTAKAISNSVDFWEDTEPFTRIGVDSDQIPANGARMDEIRIGTTLTDVATVPEPGVIGLATLAAAGMLARRRCRS
jgi:hypothetical protein